MPSNTPFIELSNFIEDTYGTPEALAQQLDLALEMLFYVEEDTFLGWSCRKWLRL